MAQDEARDRAVGRAAQARCRAGLAELVLEGACQAGLEDRADLEAPADRARRGRAAASGRAPLALHRRKAPLDVAGAFSTKGPARPLTAFHDCVVNPRPQRCERLVLPGRMHAVGEQRHVKIAFAIDP